MSKNRYVLYVLLALGFAGLIGAHEWASWASPAATSNSIGPLVLAGAGTLCFVAAGLLARKLMKGGTSN